MTLDKKTILIVDDSLVARQFAGAALQADYRVELTDDMWISPLVRELRPALVLMDVNMGVGRSGTVAVEALNRMSIRRQIKVLFYSSRPEGELRDLVERFGADGYIRKGSTMAQLRHQVKAALSPPPRLATAC